MGCTCVFLHGFLSKSSAHYGSASGNTVWAGNHMMAVPWPSCFFHLNHSLAHFFPLISNPIQSEAFFLWSWWARLVRLESTSFMLLDSLFESRQCKILMKDSS